MTSLGGDKTTSHEVDQSSDRPSRRFRFKRKHHRSDHDHEEQQRRHRHKHHRRKRRKTSSKLNDDPSAYDDSAANLPPDVAFRESLFDAMADDEGAAFWEGVYGQPIHSYPNTYKDDQKGELEEMDDEEYAQYVRRKMWEKSWEGIEAAKEEQRQKRNEEKKKNEENQHDSCKQDNTRTRTEGAQQGPDYLFDLDIERSLRRGEHRRNKRRWKSLWTNYLERWANLRALRESRNTSTDTGKISLSDKIAWPVESGKQKDVNIEEIERFIRCCAESIDGDDRIISTTLKSERVRWHPDKIQQLYGFMDLDSNTMQAVTAVFQILDRMWRDQSKKD